MLSKNVNQLSRFFVFGYLIQIHNLLGHTVAFFAHVKIAKSEFWVEFLLCFIALLCRRIRKTQQRSAPLRLYPENARSEYCYHRQRFDPKSQFNCLLQYRFLDAVQQHLITFVLILNIRCCLQSGCYEQFEVLV